MVTSPNARTGKMVTSYRRGEMLPCRWPHSSEIPVFLGRPWDRDLHGNILPPAGVAVPQGVPVWLCACVPVCLCGCAAMWLCVHGSKTRNVHWKLEPMRFLVVSSRLKPCENSRLQVHLAYPMKFRELLKNSSRSGSYK